MKLNWDRTRENSWYSKVQKREFLNQDLICCLVACDLPPGDDGNRGKVFGWDWLVAREIVVNGWKQRN